MEVNITDVKIPFGSMVVLILKWSLASIPALFILFMLGMTLLASARAFFGSF